MTRPRMRYTFRFFDDAVFIVYRNHLTHTVLWQTNKDENNSFIMKFKQVPYSIGGLPEDMEYMGEAQA